jgi:hypothetical protein
MVPANVEPLFVGEELLAALADAAYQVALRHGIKGPFIDIELDLWRELRGVLYQQEDRASCRH